MVPKALQEKQHSEQLHHIFLNFLFISILSKSRTKVCINGGKENKSTQSNILQCTHTHTHSIFSKAVSCGFFSWDPLQVFKCLWWQRLRGNVPSYKSYKSYKSYMLLNSLKWACFLYLWMMAFISTPEEVTCYQQDFCVLADIPTNTVKIQMPPTTFIAKVGCVREG